MASKVRELLADAIRRNGGYSNEAALEWSVPVYPYFTARQVAAYMVKMGYFVSLADLMMQYPRWEEIYQGFKVPWERLLEDMREGLDGDCYRTMSPDTAKKHGREYKGPGADSGFEVEFEFHGRGGKHLCVTKFEGVDLDMSSEVVIQRLTDPDENDYYRYSNQWCRDLLAMITEWNHCFRREAVESEALHHTAFYFYDHLENADEEELEAA